MKKNQNGFGIVEIILIVVLVIILVVVGWIAYRGLKSNTNNTSPTSTSTNQSTESTDTTKNNLGEGYVVLSDWGVKFKVTQGSVNVIRYYNLPSEANSLGFTNYYEFTTNRVEDLGGRCAGSTSDGPAIRLATLNRTQKEIELTTDEKLNDGQPINGYYYYLSGAQSLCSDSNDSSVMQIQVDDCKTVTDSLKSLAKH